MLTRERELQAKPSPSVGQARNKAVMPGLINDEGRNKLLRCVYM